MPDDDLLRLIALDTEDLAILSAHVQDAVLKVKDIHWLPRDGHFVLGMNRFVWEAAAIGSWRKREYLRRRSALHLARVLDVQSTGIDPSLPDTVLNLLAVRFEPGESPSGEVVLDFAEGAAIRLSVEVLELSSPTSDPPGPHRMRRGTSSPEPMAIRLNSADSDFEARFAALLAAKREVSEDVEATAREIIANVRERGDEALIGYTRKFDRFDVTAEGLRITSAEIDAAERMVAPEARDALAIARDRIEAFHRRQLPKDDRYTDALGVELGSRWTPIDAVGLYVPGGTAAYPSSLLMNAVPAKVAGVPRIVMAVPTPDGIRIRWCFTRRGFPASTKSIGSAVRRRSPPSHTAPRRSHPSSRSSAQAATTSRRQSGWSSEPSAST